MINAYTPIDRLPTNEWDIFLMPGDNWLYAKYRKNNVNMWMVCVGNYWWSAGSTESRVPIAQIVNIRFKTKFSTTN